MNFKVNDYVRLDNRIYQIEDIAIDIFDNDCFYIRDIECGDLHFVLADYFHKMAEIY